MTLARLLSRCLMLVLALAARTAAAQDWPATREPIATVHLREADCREFRQDRIALSEDRKTLFLLAKCAVDQAFQIHVYDIEQPAQPKLLHVLPVDTESSVSQAFFYDRGRIFFGQATNLTIGALTAAVTIIDVQTWPFPVVVGAVRAVDEPWRYDGISASGSYLLFRQGGKDIYVDITDPVMPIQLPERPENFRFPATPDLETWRSVAARDLSESFIDTVGDKLLARSELGLRLWDVSDADRPHLIDTIPIRPWSRDERLLPESNTILAPTPQGFEIYSIDRPPFEPAKLRATYAKAKTLPLPTHQFDYGRLTTALEDAGILRLAEANVAGIGSAERMLMLNDYGFWLTAAKRADFAAVILGRVTELAPKRTIAYLNLGDALRGAAAAAGTYDEKMRLSQRALDAYAKYRRLSGKEAPAARWFTAFVAKTTAATNVCDYVAAAYNARQPDQIFTDPRNADLTNDGRHVPFEIQYRGTLSEGWVETFGAEDVAVGHSPEEYWSPDLIAIVPFKGKYYVVYERDFGPVSVFQANVGEPCRFRRQLTGVLTTNANGALCERVRRQERFPKAATSPTNHTDPYALSLDGLKAFLNDEPGMKSLNRELEARYSVDLDRSGRKSTLGEIEFRWRACVFTAVSFLDNHRTEISRRNANLIAAQDSIFRCNGGSTEIVNVDGNWLIDIRGEHRDKRPNQIRALLRMRGEKITTICKADFLPTYVPVAPKTPFPSLRR